MENKNHTTFASFGDSFQEKIVEALIYDQQWSENMIEILKPEFFDLGHLSYIVSKYFLYYSKYRTFPSIDVLKVILRDGLNTSKISDEMMVDSVIRFLKKIKDPDFNDHPYVKERSFSFCKMQAVKLALEKSVDLANQGNLGQVIEIMKEAMSAGEDSSVGHLFDEDMDERWSDEIRDPIPLGIEELDKKEVLNGGLDKGELGVFIASPGAGKSHFLCRLAANSILNGKNVVYYTLEMRPNSIGRRIDAYITGVNSREIVEKKSEVKEFYKNLEEKGVKLGKLIVKEFPSGVPTANSFNAHIKKVEIKKKFKPDIIIVDYASEMRPIDASEATESRHKYRLILRDLRNLGRECNVPVFTALQANRTALSQSDEIITGENIAESYRSMDIPDFILSGFVKEKDKSKGVLMMFIIKNRVGNDSISFPVHVDKRTSRLSVITREKYLELLRTDESVEDDLKDKLRARLNKTMKKQLSDDIGAKEL